MLKRADDSIHFPSYYRPGFSEQDLEVIRRCTGETAARFGLGRRGRARHKPGRNRAVPFGALGSRTTRHATEIRRTS
jgi:hypothetical protein